MQHIANQWTKGTHHGKRVQTTELRLLWNYYIDIYQLIYIDKYMQIAIYCNLVITHHHYHLQESTNRRYSIASNDNPIRALRRMSIGAKITFPLGCISVLELNTMADHYECFTCNTFLDTSSVVL